MVEVLPDGDRQATQTKEGGAKQLKKMYKCRVDNCQHPPFTTKHAIGESSTYISPKGGRYVPDM